MNKSKLFLSSIMIPGVLVILTTGCATKKYVAAQLAPLNAKVGTIETKTNQNADKEESDISRVNERLMTADNQIREAAAAAQQANTLAAQANDLAKEDQTAIAVNRASDVAALATSMEAVAKLGRAMTYSVVAEGDVEFAFGKSNLTPAGRDRLDTLLQQVSSKQRVEFELVGFTDPIGPASYNLVLSRKRGDSVARYLVTRGVSLRGVHIIGFGEEKGEKVSTKEARQRARRVAIKIYAPDATVQSASLQD
jgi:outer membrane protein OmpA-like peptidoglycan-associated protein